MHAVRIVVVELKGYIYCFGNIILLLKYVQGEKGVQKFGLLNFTYLMDRPLKQNFIKQRLSTYTQMMVYSTSLTCGSFSKKTLKKSACTVMIFITFQNYYYFWKSNIPVFNLIVDSRNMIKLSKNMSLLKNQINGKSRFHQIPTICQRFLLFLNGAELWKVQWTNRK